MVATRSRLNSREKSRKESVAKGRDAPKRAAALSKRGKAARTTRNKPLLRSESTVDVDETLATLELRINRAKAQAKAKMAAKSPKTPRQIRKSKPRQRTLKTRKGASKIQHHPAKQRVKASPQSASTWDRLVTWTKSLLS